MQKCKEALQGLSRKSRLNKETMKNFLGSSPTGQSGGCSEIIRSASVNKVEVKAKYICKKKKTKHVLGIHYRTIFYNYGINHAPSTSTALLVHRVISAVLGNTDSQNNLTWKEPPRVIQLNTQSNTSFQDRSDCLRFKPKFQSSENLQGRRLHCLQCLTVLTPGIQQYSTVATCNSCLTFVH